MDFDSILSDVHCAVVFNYECMNSSNMSNGDKYTGTRNLYEYENDKIRSQKEKRPKRWENELKNVYVRNIDEQKVSEVECEMSGLSENSNADQQSVNNVIQQEAKGLVGSRRYGHMDWAYF